jgi:uncharacterized membrane protein YbhN (UPF0104 family)
MNAGGTRSGEVTTMLHRLLRPSVVLPTLLSVAILVALLGVSNMAQVLAVMEGFQYRYLLYVLAATAAYEAVRCAQWHVLLTALEIRVPLRTHVFAFLGGEVAKHLPLGNYVANYLLRQSVGTAFGRSSAATTLSMLTEVALALAGVVLLGLGDWSGWLRPVIVGGLAVFLAVVWVVRRSGYVPRVPRRLMQHPGMRTVVDEVRHFRASAVALVQPRILAVQGLLGAGYMVIGGAMLFLVARGIGAGHVSFGQVLAVSCFSLAVAQISPVPMDLGVIEASGVGALMVIGVSESTALGIMLINRVLNVGATLAMALIALVVLRDEALAVVRGPR